MNSILSRIIQVTVQSWVQSGDASCASDINCGLCADFAHSISEQHTCNVVGVYDLDDLELLAGGFSSAFSQAVKDDLIGHTAVFHDGKFYDSETPNGVCMFEDLPINKRCMTGT